MYAGINEVIKRFEGAEQSSVVNRFVEMPDEKIDRSGRCGSYRRRGMSQVDGWRRRSGAGCCAEGTERLKNDTYLPIHPKL